MDAGAHSHGAASSGEHAPACALPADALIRPKVPLISSDASACKECWGCVRRCPVQAIKVTERHSDVIQERCIQCGACVTQCGQCGHVVRNDVPRVEELLASGDPVVAVLATEFVAAMYPMSPAEVEASLEALGFYATETTTLGEELIALEYERLYSRDACFPVIRSTCPVVVTYVTKYHPELAPALAPIIPPYVAQARLIKALYPAGTRVVYVSPCFARKDEVFDPEFGGAVDCAIDFFELRGLIEGRRAETTPRLRPGRGQRRPDALKKLSLTDGFPRHTMESRSQLASDVVVLRGIFELNEFLEAVKRGENAPVVVDALHCEGCIDGPAVNPQLSVFAKRNIVAGERAVSDRDSADSLDILRFMPKTDVIRTFRARPVVTSVPADAAIDAILADGEFASRDDVLDCGACGYDTCVEHATAIWRDDSSWDMCFPLQRARLSRNVDRLAEHATMDVLTGLWNERAFTMRLGEEIARFARYETPCALLRIDVDDMTGVDSTFGRASADAALVQFGDALRSCLRATDVPARLSGDDFAVVLTGIGKTEAFVVAEKVRAIASTVRVGLGDEVEPRALSVSIGVAAPGETVRDAERMMAVALDALGQAKEMGRDQTRLAPS